MEQHDPRTPFHGGEGEVRVSRATLRAVSHDMNGALNNLTLNLELLERAVRAEGVPASACDRYFANLRRALEKLAQIASNRLTALPSAPPESTEE